MGEFKSNIVVDYRTTMPIFFFGRITAVAGGLTLHFGVYITCDNDNSPFPTTTCSASLLLPLPQIGPALLSCLPDMRPDVGSWLHSRM